MSSLEKLTGKFAVVTGAAQGIGEASAKPLAREGAMVGKVLDCWGAIDILVNNTGGGISSSFLSRSATKNGSRSLSSI